MSNLTTRVTALEKDVSEIGAGVKSILAALEGKATTAKPKSAKKGKTTAKATVTRKKGGARKTANRKPAGTTVAGKTCLVQGNRKQFIADHDWAQPGTSTRELAEAVVHGGQPLTGNWAIGPRTVERLGGGTNGTVIVAQAAASAPARTETFRRANGTIAPKSEWAIRAALEAQGLSRKVVDKRTAKAVKVLASA